MGSRVWALVVVAAPWHAESARTRDGGHHSIVFWLQADISDTILMLILCMGPVFPCLIIKRLGFWGWGMIQSRTWSFHEWDLVPCNSSESLIPCLCSLPGKDTMKILQPITQKRAFPRTHPGWHPDMGLPTCRAVRKKFLLFITTSVC